MTANPETPPSPDEEPAVVVMPPNTTPAPERATLDRFAMLAGVMETYFTQPNGNAIFLAEYEIRGEASAEFDGLAAEMRDAIKHPREATQVVNYALPGMDLGHVIVRQQLVELLDQMEGNTPDPVPGSDPVSAEAAAGPKASDVSYDQWLRRKIPLLPVGQFRDHQYPIWQVFLAGVLILLVGSALGVFIPWPGFLVWIPTMIRSVGGLIVAVTAVLMFVYRQSDRHPEREAEREEQKEALRTKAAQRRKTGKGETDADEAGATRQRKTKPTMRQRITNVFD